MSVCVESLHCLALLFGAKSCKFARATLKSLQRASFKHSVMKEKHQLLALISDGYNR